MPSWPIRRAAGPGNCAPRASVPARSWR